MKKILAVSVCLVAVCLGAFAAPPPLKPGLWEVTLQTKEPVVTEPMIGTYCITPEHANPAPPVIPANADCKLVSSASDNAAVAYALQCSKRHVSTNVKITYTGSTYSGTITTQSDTNSAVVQSIDGKWVGPCPQP